MTQPQTAQIKPRRMTLAAIHQPKPGPFRVLIYGPEKVGKSSWAAHAPKPIFISGDNGLGHIEGIDQFPTPSSYEDVIDAIDTLMNETHEFQTLVIDPLGWIEPLVFGEYIRRFPKLSDGTVVHDINDYGYFKGQAGAVDVWRSLLARLESLQAKRGMNVILVAHSQVKTTANPMGADFERYCLQLDGGPKSERAAGKLCQWPDAILFINFATVVKRVKGKDKGIGTGTRVVYTQPCDAFHAGNRYGLPDQMNLDFAEFYAHIRDPKGNGAIERLRQQITQLTAGTELESVALDAIERAGENTDKLQLIANRVTLKLKQQQESEIDNA